MEHNRRGTEASAERLSATVGGVEASEQLKADKDDATLIEPVKRAA
jgi:hypothetical protein